MSVNAIAVITGGNRGLGRATALALGAAGTDVVDEGLRTAMAERAALGRVGEPEDIGPVVAALDHRAGGDPAADAPVGRAARGRDALHRTGPQLRLPLVHRPRRQACLPRGRPARAEPPLRRRPARGLLPARRGLAGRGHRRGLARPEPGVPRPVAGTRDRCAVRRGEASAPPGAGAARTELPGAVRRRPRPVPARLHRHPGLGDPREAATAPGARRLRARHLSRGPPVAAGGLTVRRCRGARGRAASPAPSP